MLANPLLDFDRLLLVKRSVRSPALGLPQNWQSNSSLPKTGYDDSIEVLSPVSPAGELATLYRPEPGRFVGDLDLDFSGEKLLFSMPGDNGRWQVFELRSDGSGLRQLTGEQPDVDSYDACYLPNGKILVCSTAYFNAVACTGDHAAVLYLMDAAGQQIRQLCFDQEHNWCPTVLSSGRVLYTRWEYTDTVHCHSRLLFHMNPDGTEQREYLGSNSYWPNAFFYARPIPGHPTKVVAIISGHHGVPRMGELVIFDPALGRHEAAGAVQRIPGYGQASAGGAEGPTGGRQLAQVPASLSAEREVLPGGRQAHAAVAVGPVPGRRLRQPGADQGTAGLRLVRAMPLRSHAASAGVAGKGRSAASGRERCTSPTCTPARD